MRAGWLGLLLILGACEVEPPKAPVKVAINLPVRRFVLQNGLEVIIQEDHRSPRVAINLRYHVGYKDDLPGRAGITHLVEHLQFSGSEHTRADSFFHTMNDLGAEEVNGTTGPDATSFFETVPASSLDAALWIEADRMGSAKHGWPAAMIAREKNVVGQELRLRYRNEPNGFRYQLLSRAVYPEGHPYRQSLDEEQQERASTAAELRDFAAKFYAPDNATLMLVGDVTPEQAKELVTRHFASIEPCINCRTPKQIAPVQAAALKRMRVVADVDTPMVFVVWPLPAPGQDGFYEAPYALGEIQGNARDYTENAERRKPTMRPNSVNWIGPYGGRLGTIGAIGGVLTSDGKAEDLVDGIDIARRNIVAREWASMSALRSSWIARELRHVEALGDRAARMQQYLEEFGDANYVMTDLHAIQDVTKARMLAAVDHFFDLDRAAVVIITPDPSAPRGGKIVEEVRR